VLTRLARLHQFLTKAAQEHKPRIGTDWHPILITFEKMPSSAFTAAASVVEEIPVYRKCEGRGSVTKAPRYREFVNACCKQGAGMRMTEAMESSIWRPQGACPLPPNPAEIVRAPGIATWQNKHEITHRGPPQAERKPL